MTIKSQIDYACPACHTAWIPYAKGLACPQCERVLPDAESVSFVDQTLESAKFNKRLYGKFELEYWFTRRLGDRYFAWAFKALDLTDASPELSSDSLALATLMELDLEEMSPYRAHLLGYFVSVIDGYRIQRSLKPDEWTKMPEPEKPFFGRKIIEDAN
ncbi:MAG: hypothetical protein WCT04_04025 [Planctomycetota bacterium]